ncbi:polysaccharide deacetylase family protein, partial [Campylobacter concisus]|uniref:polysaccharide deacetylase family protein n=1 Tax=Campylobacter concisus TaxID=199 RepID=UPI0015E17379
MSVTVLMYHHVLEKSGFIASSVDEFRSHMKFLAENGYKTLSINEFIAYKKGKLEVPKKSVCITFDDGWMDNYVYAYPIVKEFGLKANLFIVTGWIEAAQKSHEISRGPLLNGSHSECKN